MIAAILRRALTFAASFVSAHVRQRRTVATGSN